MGLNPTFPNYSDASGRRCDQLYAKSDFLLADVVGSPYIGADGTLGVAPSSLQMFDLRPYSSVYCYVRSAGYTGATKLQLRVMEFDALYPHPGNFVWVGSVLSMGLGTSAAGEQVHLYDSIAGYASTGTANINESAITVAPRPLFCQFQLLVTGVMSALTGLRLFVYGVR